MASHYEVEAASWRKRAEAAERQLRDIAVANAKAEGERLLREQEAQKQREKDAREAALAAEIEEARKNSWRRFRQLEAGKDLDSLLFGRCNRPADGFDVDRDVWRIPQEGWPEDDGPHNHRFTGLHGAAPLGEDGKPVDDISNTFMGKLLAQAKGPPKP